MPQESEMLNFFFFFFFIKKGGGGFLLNFLIIYFLLLLLFRLLCVFIAVDFAISVISGQTLQVNTFKALLVTLTILTSYRQLQSKHKQCAAILNRKRSGINTISFLCITRKRCFILRRKTKTSATKTI